MTTWKMWKKKKKAGKVQNKTIFTRLSCISLSTCIKSIQILASSFFFKWANVTRFQVTQNYKFLKHRIRPKQRKKFAIWHWTYQKKRKLEKAFAARSWWRLTEGKLGLSSRTLTCHVPDKTRVTVIRFTSQLDYCALSNYRGAPSARALLASYHTTRTSA